jgi:hypothetical protein
MRKAARWLAACGSKPQLAPRTRVRFPPPVSVDEKKPPEAVFFECVGGGGVYRTMCQNLRGYWALTLVGVIVTPKVTPIGEGLDEL